MESKKVISTALHGAAVIGAIWAYTVADTYVSAIWRDTKARIVAEEHSRMLDGIAMRCGDKACTAKDATPAQLQAMLYTMDRRLNSCAMSAATIAEIAGSVNGIEE